MEYLMKLIFNLIKNSRCDPFPKILVFKWCIYYFIYFSNPRETFIEFIYDKIKFKMATSNSHSFRLYVVKKLTNRFLLFAKFKRKERGNLHSNNNTIPSSIAGYTWYIFLVSLPFSFISSIFLFFFFPRSSFFNLTSSLYTPCSSHSRFNSTFPRPRNEV